MQRLAVDLDQTLSGLKKSEVEKRHGISKTQLPRFDMV
jgi:hypothetical protein